MVIWELFQQWKIEETERKVEAQTGEYRKGEHRVDDSLKRLEQLALATEAVWSFLKEKHQLDDEDLAIRMEEIDMRDGVRDGKSKAKTTRCPTCSQKLSSKLKKCPYCGADNLAYNPFSA